ncbi:MAG: hypothetical protein RQ748_02000 [Elusimicrobiales bacterium]|nr:hypothetical protein [Elusimicrobiales bacterium]
MAENGIFEEYERIRDGVKYLSGGREYSRAETEELLRSPDPFERVRAWDMLRGGWAGLEDELAGLLGRALAAEKAGGAAEVFGEDSGPLLEAAYSLRARLMEALELKAGRVGAPGFSCCDLWARLPAPADAQMPLAEGLRRLGLILDAAVDGGRGLIMEFFPGNRLVLEGERPQCLPPDASSPAVVRLPESFRGVYPSDLPVIAREIGRAVHCDMDSRAAGAARSPVFEDLLGYLFEEISWAGLRAEADDNAASELTFNRLPRLADDLLIAPATLELKEKAAAPAGNAPTPGAVKDMAEKVFLKWLGADAAGAGFWMRSGELFRPGSFAGFAGLAGRFLSLGLLTGGRLSAAALEEAVSDTRALDLGAWLSRRAPGGWSSLSAGALYTVTGLR